jgi:excisionase family DNA binding protein
MTSWGLPASSSPLGTVDQLASLQAWYLGDISSACSGTTRWSRSARWAEFVRPCTSGPERRHARPALSPARQVDVVRGAASHGSTRATKSTKTTLFRYPAFCVSLAPTPMPPLSVRETARRLGVHENTVRNWANRGILRPLRLPGSGYRRFDAAEVDRVARQMREAMPGQEARVTRPASPPAVGRRKTGPEGNR